MESRKRGFASGKLKMESGKLVRGAKETRIYPSPLGKVDCEARRMRLRCANYFKTSSVTRKARATFPKGEGHVRLQCAYFFKNLIHRKRSPFPKGEGYVRLRSKPMP